MRYKKYIGVPVVLLSLLLTVVGLRADYNPTNPPEPGGVTVRVAVTPSGAGSVSPSSATVQPGSNVSFRASAYSNYRFVEWQDTEGQRLSTSTSYSFVSGEKDMLIVAKFEYSPTNPTEPTTPVAKGRLIIGVNPSGAGYTNGSGTYEVGQKVNISASSYNDFLFVNWTRDGEVIGNSSYMTYTMLEGDNRLTANYRYNPGNPSEPISPAKQHRLYVKSSPAGSCGFNITSGTKYNEGESIWLNASCYSGYVLKNWTNAEGQVLSNSTGVYVTMGTEDMQLTANCEYSPTNPGEPSSPSTKRNMIYGGRELVMPGSDFVYNVLLENKDDITGINVDVTAPELVSLDMESATLSTRAGAHTLEMESVESGATRFKVRGSEPLAGANGAVLRIPGHLDASAEVDTTIPVTIAKGVIYKADGTQTPVDVLNGSVQVIAIPETLPESPDFVVTDINVAAGEVMPGDRVEVDWRVENRGIISSTGGWSETVYLVDADGRRSTLGTIQYDGENLEPGGSVSRSATFAISKLPGLSGPVNVAVSLTSYATSGEIDECQANNTTVGSGEPLILLKELTLELPAEVREGTDRQIRGRLSRSGNWTEAETFGVTMTEGDVRLSAPESITIPTGQSATYFELSLADNDMADGDAEVSLSVSGNGYDEVSGLIKIIDDELPLLTLTAEPDEVSEGESMTLTVEVPRAVTDDLEVKLAADISGRLDMPASVTVKQGTTKASVTATALQNDRVDGDAEMTIFATAQRYLGAEVPVTVLDDDIPTLTMELTPTEVSEDAGPAAIQGVITRTDNFDKAVTIEISDDSNGKLYYPSRRIEMTAGVKSVEFAIGVLDNNLVDGDLDVEVTAAVYIASCSCSAPVSSVGSVSKHVRIIDNDGPSIGIKSSASVIVEGDANGITLTISRNTPTTNALTVHVASDADDVLVYDHEVVIPRGESSATVKVIAPSNGVEDDSRTVVFSAEAEGFAKATFWAMISDSTLPDAKVSAMQVSDKEVLPGQHVEVTVSVQNVGSSKLREAMKVELELDGKVMATAYTTGEIDPTGTEDVKMDVEMPDKIGAYKLVAKLNGNKQVKEYLYTNNTSVPVEVRVRSPYQAIVSVDKAIYAPGEQVSIAGQLSGEGIADADVEIYVVNGNARQTISAHSDAAGAFSALYKPYGTQYGHFSVGACYPGEGAGSEQAGFDIYGISYDNSQPVICRLVTGKPYSGKLLLRNPGTLPISGVKVDVAYSGDDVEVKASIPREIPGGASVELPFTLTAKRGSTGTEWLEVNLRVTSAEAEALPLTLYYYASTPAASLTASVESIETNLSIDEPMEYPFTITNTGGQETGRITLALPEWISAVTPATMPSLQPGEEATVVLKLASNSKMNLNMAVTGHLGINSEKGDGVSIPYSVIPVTEKTGKLRIEVCDQYTYYTEEAPHVAHADVTLSNPTTGLPVLLTDTGEEGVCTVELQAGYYQLDVVAEKHEAFRDFVYVSPGETLTVTADVGYNPISISWDVEETEVEDEYLIETVVKYETNVPMPVVKVTLPKSIDGDNMAVGDATMITMNLTNVGLMRAFDVRLLLPTDLTEWKFEALDYTEPFELDAQQSVDVPIRITRIADESQQRVRRREVVENMFQNFNNCMAAAGNSYKGMCGKHIKFNTTAENMAMKMCATSATMMALGEVLEKIYGNGWQMPMVGGGGGGMSSDGGNKFGGDGSYGEPKSTFSICNECDAKMADQLITTLTGQTWLKALSEAMNEAIDQYREGHRGDSFYFVVKKCGKDVAEFTGKQKAGELLSNLWDIGSFVVEVRKAAEPCKKGTTGGAKSKAKAESGSGHSMSDIYTEVGQAYVEQLETMQQFMLMLYGDEVWCGEYDDDKVAFMEYVYGLADGYEPTDEELFARKPASVTLEQARNLYLHANGVALTSPSEDELSARLDAYEETVIKAESDGYGNLTDKYFTTHKEYVDYLHDLESNSVCATVSLKISQTMTMTRQAFRGTLTVFNGHESEPMQDLVLNLVVRDDKGNVATSHEFQINAESLDGFTGAPELPGGWDLAAQATGKATVLFIPTKYAAPDKEVRYSFGGTISYMDPYNGKVVTRNLYPSVLTVKPSPELDLTYFMQRNVYADDPLTPEVIEEKQPAEFAVVINNKGAGDATNVRMLTRQPEIIENEKGLLIDFSLVSSQLNGAEKVMSLGGSIATDFGTIAAGTSSYAQWWLEASLLGHFIDYDVTATHVTSYGNPDLSLLDRVTIHELVHGFTADDSGEVPVRGFLVNDIRDADDTADTVYFSDGSAETGAKPVAGMIAEQTADNEYDVTVTVGASQTDVWYFGSMADPAGGRKRLVSVVRKSDGKEMPVDNFWQTWATISDGKDPVHEDMLHAVVKPDRPVETYTLTFEPRPEVELEVVEFTGVEAGESYDKPVETIGVKFSKPIDGSTFSADDLTLTCAGEPVSLADVGVVEMSNQYFEIDLGSATLGKGNYVLSVLTGGITDGDGYEGRGGKSISWIQTSDYSGVDMASDEADGLRVTPVPVGDRMMLEGSFGVLRKVMLLDMAGALTREWSDVASGTNLDMTGISPGCYIVQAISSDRHYIVKIVKK